MNYVVYRHLARRINYVGTLSIAEKEGVIFRCTVIKLNYKWVILQENNDYIIDSFQRAKEIISCRFVRAGDLAKNI